MPRKPRKSQEEWHAQKEHIRNLYVDQKQTLEQTMKKMIDIHGFHATKREYIIRLSSWQMSKNLKQCDHKMVHERHLAKKETRVLLTDKAVDPQRLRRAQARYKFGAGRPSQTTLSTSVPNRGVMIRSPSPIQTGLKIKLALETIPWFKFQHQFTIDFFSILQKLTPESDPENISDLSAALFRFGNFSPQDSVPLSSQHLESILPQKCPTDVPFAPNESAFHLIQLFIYLFSNNSLPLQASEDFLAWMIDNKGALFIRQVIGYLRNIRIATVEIFLNRLLLGAISLGYEDIAVDLLKNHVDPHGGNSQQCPMRQTFSYKLRVFVVDKTINPLQLAVIVGNFPICQSLLNHGANPNASSLHMPFTPLELAISLNQGNFAIAQLLINLYADINMSCSFEIINHRVDNAENTIRLIAKYTERTLAMKAVEIGNRGIVEILVRHGADLNERSKIMGTAIQTAVRNKDMEMIRLLLGEGVKPNISDVVENFAKYGACYLSNFESREKGFSADESTHFDTESSILSTARSYFDSHTDWWSFLSPVQIAVKHNDRSLVEYLLHRGADIRTNPCWNLLESRLPRPKSSKAMALHQHMVRSLKSKIQSALHDAVQNGNIVLSRLLLDNGAPVDQVDASGKTPLQMICGPDGLAVKQTSLLLGQGSRSVPIRVCLANILLSSGAYVDAPGPIAGKTALEAAEERGDHELIDLLHCYGGGYMKFSGIHLTKESDSTLLYHAALRGDTEHMLYLLTKKGVKINRLYPSQLTSETYGTILQAGVKSGNINVVEKLLVPGSGTDTVVNGETAICAAVREQHLLIFDMLVEHGASLDVPGMTITPLAIAALNCFEHMVTNILQAGADANHLSYDPGIGNSDHRYAGRATPLMWALNRLWGLQSMVQPDDDLVQRIENIALKLLSGGADPNRVPEGWNCPLNVACLYMSYSFTKALTGYGAKLDTRNKSHHTPIMHAIFARRNDVVQLLVEKGADLQGALDVALHQRHSSEDKRSAQEKVVETLMKAGARLNEERELLARAIWTRSNDLAQNILEGHPDVDVNYPFDTGDSGKITPLEAAAFDKNMDLTMMLLNRGANPNYLHTTNMYIGTALQAAAMKGHFNLTKLLIERGANIHAPAPNLASCHQGRTALQHAAARGFLDIIHLLLENDKESETIDARIEEASGIAENNGHAYLAKMLCNYKTQGLSV